MADKMEMARVVVLYGNWTKSRHLSMDLPSQWEDRSTLFLEEPEHQRMPRQIVDKVRYALDAMFTYKRNLVIITCSEYAVGTVLNTLSRKQLTPADVHIYSVDDEGLATFKPVNNVGQIAGGLHEFVEADSEMMGELLMAATQKEI